MKVASGIAVAGMLMLGGCTPAAQDGTGQEKSASSALLRDGSDGANWPGYGRTYGEQHFSPLDQINAENVKRLGLAWSIDLGPGNPVTAPIAVDGILYIATGYSVVRAIDAATGSILWTYDPKVTEKAGEKMRLSWGIRGLAWWDGKVYVGTTDGRLIAINAKDGQPVWSIMTVDPKDGRYITGAPRVFEGKVIIGHGGADGSPIRGYVSTYDTATGKLLWRFYTVPGDPAKGFEDETQAMAAKTWSGDWWKFGGGGTAWNAFAYDPDTDTVFVGTGNGAPWNRRIRSGDKGDNLFLSSIVALNATTGKYKWHYQVNPGESWDYNAAMDMHFADMVIDGKPHKVLMQAPKNGFFYVLDRVTGKLLSADPVTKVTWADGIDLKSGRPIENPAARYPNGKTFELWPSPHGAHGWLPSAFSPKSGLVYLPLAEIGYKFSDAGIDLKNWRFEGHSRLGIGVGIAYAGNNGSSLTAWDPVKRKVRWRVPTAGAWNGGILATGGNLVYQGQATGIFSAYDANSGKNLWSFDAQSPVLAPPISYAVKGRQYVTVLTGMGTTLGLSSDLLPKPIDYHTQVRRVLTFALDAAKVLPKPQAVSAPAPVDAEFKADAAGAGRGGRMFVACVFCHGQIGKSGGTAPELARSPVPISADAFDAVVRQGALRDNGMPKFGEFSDEEMKDLRQFIRTEAHRVNSVAKGQQK